ncbi:MAG: hypothetical protein SF051_07295 [Elusimicrobiota bacterium]|nr:hypothetical protein [Elusimicrobiota bacterium]
MKTVVSRGRRLWFALTNALARARFLAGRASFVEAVVAKTQNDLTPVVSADGRPLPPRLMAHHLLAPRPPRSGPSGWSLYEERLLGPARRVTRLTCAFCGHSYYVEVSGPREVESAAFVSEWFRFTPSAFAGPNRLDCPRCEQSAVPEVAHLREP